MSVCSESLGSSGYGNIVGESLDQAGGRGCECFGNKDMGERGHKYFRGHANRGEGRKSQIVEKGEHCKLWSGGTNLGEGNKRKGERKTNARDQDSREGTQMQGRREFIGKMRWISWKGDPN